MNELRHAITAARSGLRSGPDGEIIAEFCFAESFPGFAGHFPGYPLLPAVVQVLIAQTLIEEHVETPLSLTEVGAAKFFEQLRPQTPITVVCSERRPLPAARWDVQLSAAGAPAATFRLKLRPEEG
jgi:3-hydroxyacyl-[acyl-carrier-protein] dehydratase